MTPASIDKYKVSENCTSENLISSSVLPTVKNAVITAIYAIFFVTLFPNKKGENKILLNFAFTPLLFCIIKTSEKVRIKRLIKNQSGRTLKPQRLKRFRSKTTSHSLTLNAIGLLFNKLLLFYHKTAIFASALHNILTTTYNYIMAIIFLRSAIIYVALLVIMRLMGKRQIGEMQPFEFTVTLLIAELACIPMSDFSIPLLYGISAILAIFVLHQFMTLLDKSGNFCKFLFSGKPSVVINKNGIDFKELKKNNLDVSDLIESMRTLGYFSLDSVLYAIYEANGNLTAVENTNLSFPPDLPVALVRNGKTDKKNLDKIGLSENEFLNKLNTLNVRNVKNLGVFTIDANGRYYFQEYDKKYVTGYLQIKEQAV